MNRKSIYIFIGTTVELIKPAPQENIRHPIVINLRPSKIIADYLLDRRIYE